jgi:hypothetical protein
MEYDGPSRVNHHYIWFLRTIGGQIPKHNWFSPLHTVFTDDWRADSKAQLVFSPLARKKIHIKMETESIKSGAKQRAGLIPRKEKARNCG